MSTSLTEFNSIAYLFPNFKEILEKEEQPVEVLIKNDKSGKLLVDLYEQTISILHISNTSPVVKKLSEKIVNAFTKGQDLPMILQTFNPTEEQNHRFKKIQASFVQESPGNVTSVEVTVMAPPRSLAGNLEKNSTINLKTKHLTERARLQKEQLPLQPGELIIERCKNFFLTFGRGSKDQNRIDELNFYAFIQAQSSLQDLREARTYIQSLEEQDLATYVKKIKREIGPPNPIKFQYGSWEQIFTHYRNWMLSIIVARITKINAGKMRNNGQA